MDFSCIGTNLLSFGYSQDGRGESDSGVQHDGFVGCWLEMTMLMLMENFSVRGTLIYLNSSGGDNTAH